MNEGRKEGEINEGKEVLPFPKKPTKHSKTIGRNEGRTTRKEYKEGLQGRMDGSVTRKKRKDCKEGKEGRSRTDTRKEGKDCKEGKEGLQGKKIGEAG